MDNFMDWILGDQPLVPESLAGCVQEVPTEIRVSTAVFGAEDYFGSVAVVCLGATGSEVSHLNDLGVCDSEGWSNSKCHDAASEIQHICHSIGCKPVLIRPLRLSEMLERYSDKGYGFRRILEWAQAVAIEKNLRGNSLHNVSVLHYAQTSGLDEGYIQKRLAKGEHSVTNIDSPTTEDLIAASAASVVARSWYLSYRGRLNKEYHETLPRGTSSPEIIDVGKRIVVSRGVGALRGAAKVHFKVTDQILGSQSVA